MLHLPHPQHTVLYDQDCFPHAPVGQKSDRTVVGKSLRGGYIPYLLPYERPAIHSCDRAKLRLSVGGMPCAQYFFCRKYCHPGAFRYIRTTVPSSASLGSPPWISE